MPWYLLVDALVPVQVGQAEADVVPVRGRAEGRVARVGVHTDVVQRVGTSQPGQEKKGMFTYNLY